MYVDTFNEFNVPTLVMFGWFGVDNTPSILEACVNIVRFLIIVVPYNVVVLFDAPIDIFFAL